MVLRCIAAYCRMQHIAADLRDELLPLAYTDDVGAPIVAQIDTVFPRLAGICMHMFGSFVGEPRLQALGFDMF